MDYIEITTINQVLFHLTNKEVVVFNMSDGTGYFEQQGNDITICLQPNIGSANVYTGNRSNLKKTFKHIQDEWKDTKFYVVKGLSVGTRRVTMLDKIADFFRNKSI